MIKSVAFVAIIAARLIYQPDWDQQPAPFTSKPSFSAASLFSPAKLIDFSGSLKNNKVVLEWAVDENETADQFLVEKSLDGKNYRIAALVFGTDMPATGRYQFYEKAGNQRVHYRIKLIGKNKETAYSPVLEISSGV